MISIKVYFYRGCDPDKKRPGKGRKRAKNGPKRKSFDPKKRLYKGIPFRRRRRRREGPSTPPLLQTPNFSDLQQDRIKTTFLKASAPGRLVHSPCFCICRFSDLRQNCQKSSLFHDLAAELRMPFREKTAAEAFDGSGSIFSSPNRKLYYCSTAPAFCQATLCRKTSRFTPCGRIFLPLCHSVKKI